jgi:hypothetical protein
VENGVASSLNDQKGEVMNLKNCTIRLAQCFKILLVAIAAGSLVQSAHASLLFSDGFNYSTGGIGTVGAPTWVGSNNGLQVTNANLTFSGLQDLGGNALLLTNGTGGSTLATYANQTAGQVYFSFLFDPLVIDSGNNFFVALNPGATAPGGSGDAMNTSYFTTGKIALRSNPQAATTGTGSALTIGTTYLIVEELDLTAKTSTLWINPTPGAAAPAATASLSGLSATAVDNVGFKTTSGGATGAYLIDNLLIGTTFADVTPAVPEPSTLMLVGAGLSLMLGMIRRRRS